MAVTDPPVCAHGGLLAFCPYCPQGQAADGDEGGFAPLTPVALPTLGAIPDDEEEGDRDGCGA